MKYEQGSLRLKKLAVGKLVSRYQKRHNQVFIQKNKTEKTDRVDRRNPVSDRVDQRNSGSDQVDRRSLV